MRDLERDIADVLLWEGEKDLHALRDAVDARAWEELTRRKAYVLRLAWSLLCKAKPYQLKRGLRSLQSKNLLRVRGERADDGVHRMYSVRPEPMMERFLMGEAGLIVNRAVAALHARGAYEFGMPVWSPNEFAAFRQLLQRALAEHGSGEIFMEMDPPESGVRMIRLRTLERVIDED